jgi:hypothetical protein
MAASTKNAGKTYKKRRIGDCDPINFLGTRRD